MKKEYAFHPIANLFPLLEGGEFAALVKDIAARGLHEAIVIYEDQILDGRNRYRACLEAGVELRFREMLFNSHADAVAYVIGANIIRRHLTMEQRRELIEKLLKLNPEQSNRQIAATVKVDHKTVGAIRREAEGRGEIPHVEKRVDSKGRSQPSRHKSDRGAQQGAVEPATANFEPTSEPATPTTPATASSGKPRQTPRTKQQIRHQQAGQSASSFCTSIVVALDTADADAIVGYLCTNHIDTLVEIAQHAKFAPIIAAVTAKLGIGMKFIGLQSEVEELRAERDQLRAELAKVRGTEMTLADSTDGLSILP